MLRVSLDVNGRIIGHIGIYNISEEPDTKGKQRYSYSIQIYEDKKRGVKEVIKDGDLYHNYEDGALELVRKVLS